MRARGVYLEDQLPYWIVQTLQGKKLHPCLMCNGSLIGVVNRCSTGSGVIDFSNKGISLFLEHLALHFHAWIWAKSANVKV